MRLLAEILLTGAHRVKQEGPRARQLFERAVFGGALEIASWHAYLLWHGTKA